jgi:hypothetical protein
MRLYELIEAIDRTQTDGSQSPLTSPGDSSWQHDKDNVLNWFKRPFLTNGPKGNYMLPIKKKKVK